MKKKIFLKKVDFFYIRSNELSELLAHFFKLKPHTHIFIFAYNLFVWNMAEHVDVQHVSLTSATRPAVPAKRSCARALPLNAKPPSVSPWAPAILLVGSNSQHNLSLSILSSWSSASTRNRERRSIRSRAHFFLFFFLSFLFSSIYVFIFLATPCSRKKNCSVHKHQMQHSKQRQFYNYISQSDARRWNHNEWR